MSPAVARHAQEAAGEVGAGAGDKQPVLEATAHPAEGTARAKVKHQFKRTIKLQSVPGASPSPSLPPPEDASDASECAAVDIGLQPASSARRKGASRTLGSLSARAPAFVPTAAAIAEGTPPAWRRKTTSPREDPIAPLAHDVKLPSLASVPPSAYLTPQRRREQAQTGSRSASPSPSASRVTASRSPSSSWNADMKASDEYLRLASAPMLSERLAALSLSLDDGPARIARADTTHAHDSSPVQSRPQQQQQAQPKLLILDLNGTLCARKKRTKLGATTARPRPFLSSFFRYIFGKDEAGDRRFAVMIWSSAQRESVASLLIGMGLDASSPLLEAVWDRSSLGLTPEEFNQKVAVTKDLDKVWSSLAWLQDTEYGPRHWSQRDTLLIDDTADKAVLQPFNHLVLRPWEYGSADATDDELLRLVGVLEALRGTDNVSAALKSEGYREDTRRESLVMAGQRVLEKACIPVMPLFDGRWMIALSMKTNRPTTLHSNSKTEREDKREWER